MFSNDLTSNKIKLTIKLGSTATVKAAAALVAFALTAMVTRSLPNNEAGLLLLGITLLSVLSIFCRLGLDNVILRLLSAHEADKFSQSKLNLGLIWISFSSIIITSIGMLFSEEISIVVFNKPEFSLVIFWLLPALPAMVITFLISVAFQSQVKLIYATIFQNLGVSSLFIFFFWSVCQYLGNSESSIFAAQLYSLSAILIMLFAIVLWFKQGGIEFFIYNLMDRELLKPSINLWLASNMALLVQWSGLLIAGMMVTPSELAYLVAAQRSAMLVKFFFMVSNMITAPSYAKFWREGDFSQFKQLSANSTKGLAIVIIPVASLLVFYANDFMCLFGSDYEAGAILLVIIAVGQCLNAITGATGNILNMSGHETEYRKVTLFTGPIAIFLAVILTCEYGVVGAAISTAIGVAIENLLAIFWIKRNMGFWIWKG